MLCLPKPRVSLGQIRQTTQDMLRRGASIHELNTMRTQLEVLKGGGLARELGHVRDCHCYLLSDVIGDDTSVIASGPMHDAFPPRTPHTIVAGNNSVIDALSAWCARSQIELARTTRGVIGDAADAGQTLAQQLIASDSDQTTAVIMGGEPTVDTHGSDGIGGPMLELGISAACELSKASFDWSLLTFTTDGVDGPSGAAGMVMARSMLNAPIKQQAARAALSQHDTLSICDTLGATIRTGPSGTNVNDIAIAIRWSNDKQA
jgi:hydroxypyruvate reductase